MSRIRTHIIALLFGVVLTSTHARGQSFADGYKLYATGNFKAAVSSFAQALRKSKSNAEKANIYKYLGISQFMINQNAPAAGSFKNAVLLNPRTDISPKEVLDVSVIPYFTKVKAATIAAAKSSKARSKAENSKAKQTTLTVKSNVRATVLINGILAGNVGDRLEVPGGVLELTLQAKGYISKRAKVRITPNKENSVSLELSKPKPKPKPKPKRQPRKKAPSKLVAPNPGTPDLFDDPAAIEDPSLAGRDLAGEFSADAARPTQPQYLAPPQPQQPTYQQPPPNPYGGYQQPYQPPAYQQQQPYGYQAPPPSPYGYPTQPYPAPYTQPAPVYPPQPAYPYAPAQPPAQVQPPAPVIVDPVPLPKTDPEPLPPVDYFDDAPKDKQFLGKPQKRRKTIKRRRPSRVPIPGKSKRRSSSPRRSKTKSSSTFTSDSTTVFINLLPFGAGQFNRRDYLLGSAFAAGEAFALYWWYTNKAEADEAIADAEAYFESDASEEQKEEFEAETAAYVDEKRQQQQYGQYGFLGLWVAGVAEAFINTPQKASSKRRRLGYLGETEPSRASYTDEELEQRLLSQAEGHQPELSLGVLIDKDDLSEEKPVEPKLGLKMDWKF